MKNKIKAGWYREQQREALLNTEYFSWNKCKIMLDSPRAFFRHYAKNKVTEPTKAMDWGTLIHAAVLESKRFREKFIIQPEFTGFTKDGKLSTRSSEAKEKEAAWNAKLRKDQIVVTGQEMENLIEIVENLMAHDGALQLLTGGKAEGWGYVWDEFFGRWQLIRPDFITGKGHITVEIKTTSKRIRDGRDWAREAFNMGYHGQLAHNARGVHIHHNIPGDELRAAWIVIQSIPPFDISVFTANENILTAGKEKCFKAYHSINEHLERDPMMENSKLWLGRQRNKVEEVSFEPWMCRSDSDLDDITQFNQP